MSILPVYIIARLTLHEAARKRLVIAVALLTLVLLGLVAWGFTKLIEGNHNRVNAISPVEMLLNVVIIVILLGYMFSVILAMGAAFLAAPAIAGDIESGLALAILPRPIRRSEIVLGKWLGLAILLAGYTTVSIILALIVINLITGYTPPHPLGAIAFIVAQSLVVLTISLVGSTRLAPMTCGIIAVALFGAAWIMGIAATIGGALNNTALVNAGTVVSLILPTDGLWRGAVYNLEPAVLLGITSQLARGNPFYVGAPPPPPYIIWAIGWVIVMIAVAMLNFRRRDI